MMNDPVLGRKLFRKTQARDKLREIGGIMASSPELMTTVARYRDGGSIYGNVSLGNMITSIKDFLNTGDAQSGIGQIQEENALRRAGITRDDLARIPANVTPEDLRRIEAATQANRAADAAENAAAMTIPEGDLRAPIQNIQSQLSDLGGLMTPSQVAGSEASLARLQEEQTKRLGQDVFGEISRPEEEGMGEGLVEGFQQIEGFQQKPEDEAITGGANVSKDGTVKPAPPAIDESSITTDLQKSTAKVNEKRKELVSFLQGNASEREKNDAVLEMFGFKSPEEEIKGLKKQAKLNADLYREIAGVDPEDDKKIDGYNLAFMGFMIAAGDSPNALQNIANGMAKGTKNMMDTAKSRQARDQKFKIAGLDKAIADDKERKQVLIDSINKSEDRRFQFLRDELKSETTLQNTLLQLSSQELMLNKKLSVQKEIASDDRQSDEARATANNQIKLLTTQIVAMPELAALAIANVGSENLAEDPSLFVPALQQVLEDPDQLATAATIANMGKTSTDKTRPAEYQYQIGAGTAANREAVTPVAIERLKGGGIENPTATQIRAMENRILAEEAAGGITSALTPQAQSAGPTTVFDQQPSAAVLQQLYQQGVRQVTIGGQVYPLQSQ